MLEDESFRLLPSKTLWMGSVVQEENRAKNITATGLLWWSYELPAHFKTHAHSYSCLSPLPGPRHRRPIKSKHAEKQRKLNGKHHFLLFLCFIFSDVLVARLKRGQKAESWNKTTGLNHQLLLQASDQNL